MNNTYTIPSFGPSDLLTSTREHIRRVQVDTGNTGFFDGREFRYFREVEIPANQSVWTRVTADAFGIILRLQTLTVEEGAVRFRAWRDATITGVTFAAPASPTSGIFQNNGLPSAPARTRTTIIEEGGNHTAIVGGVVSEVIRVRAPTSTAQRATFAESSQSERGVPGGVFYLQLENTANSTCTVVYSLQFEERIGQG
jgi:hypothetical protein